MIVSNVSHIQEILLIKILINKSKNVEPWLLNLIRLLLDKLVFFKRINTHGS